MVDIINAAPMVVDLGTRDMSIRQVPENPLDIPQHLPLVYLFAEKGPVGRTYIDHDNVSLTQVFGDRTFDVNSKYYTHQTPFVNAFAGAGNNCVVHRLMAPDAKDVANVAMYLDVLETQVPVYKKNTDGSIELDEQGEPVVVEDGSGDPLTISGYKVAWVLDHTVADLGEYRRGDLTVRAGLQTEGGQQSQQYPIFEFSAADPGEAGNRLAVKIVAAMGNDLVPFPDSILNDGKMYPYYFGMVNLVDEITGKTNPILNSFGHNDVRFITKKEGTDPNSGAVIDLDKVTRDMYINVPVALNSGLGNAYIYSDNLDTVLELFYDAEKNISDDHRDNVINNSEDNHHALNIIDFTSSNGSPYQSVKLVNFAGATRITRNTNIYLKGSSDGTIDEDLLDTLVQADLENYNNNLHEYNDLVMNPESIIYDSGFSIDTKKAFPKFISRRKDTFVALSTYSHKDPAITLDQQYSVAIALKTMLELYPESATFGTSVMRGIVVGGSGELINSLYNKRVPLTYDIGYKAARYMGARNGSWKNGHLFDRAPGSIIRTIKNIDVTWVPASTRNTLWSTGLIFPLNYSVRQAFFPGLQTVYENDTSVLNSFFVAVAISYLNKINHAAWREFSGTASLSNAQLEARVDEFIARQVKDKFDNLFIIVPNTTVTEEDAIRGFSWHSDIKIYAPNLKTVAIAQVTAYRLEDYEQ